MTRVMVFVDGSKLYHSLRDDYGRTDLDFSKLGPTLCGEERELVRVYYYNARVDQSREPDRYKDQQRFFDGFGASPSSKSSLALWSTGTSPKSAHLRKASTCGWRRTC